MRKDLRKVAWLGAIALAATTSFSACTSDDEPVVEGTGEGVKVAFAFNVGNLNQNATTRQSETTTQAGGSNFNGMNFWIYNFAGTTAPTASSAIAATNEFFKSEPLTNSDIYVGTSTDSHKEYLVSVPQGTGRFVFYGVGTDLVTSGTADDTYGTSADIVKNKQNGVLNNTLPARTASSPTALSGITFSLQAINTDVSSTQTTLASYMTAIANATTTGDSPKTWKDMAEADDQQGLGLLYKHFTSGITDYAGSSKDILNVVNDLVDNLLLYDGINSDDAVSAAIQRAITTQAFDWVDSDDHSKGVTFKSSLSDEVKHFPEYYGLPSGSMQLEWTAGTPGSFSYRTSSSMGSTGVTTAASLDYKKIAYPSRLMYFANSGLYATTNENDVFQTTSTNWGISTNWTSTWTETTVSTKSKKVAMANNAQYGTALLKSTVKVQFTSGATEFEDNRAAALHDGSTGNQTFGFGTNGLKFKGIIIGSQPQMVDWEFLPSTTTNDYMIYDNQVQETVDITANGGSTSPTYTLVLDNYKSSDSQDKVKIVLEMENNTGTDFYGADGVVKDGATFYLIGELDVDATTKTGTLSWTDYQPNEGKNTNRVFVQDVKTEVNLTINEKSLQKAYNVIPDLLSTQMVFGLSVDLTWETGYTFDIDL